MSEQDKKIVFLGCALDPDERQEAIDQKLAAPAMAEGGDDPYLRVLDMIRDEVDSSRWREEGSLETPSWLRPVPPDADRDAMLVDNFVGFVDGQGCREAASALGAMAAEQVGDDIPCLIAVDHSLTGGMLEHLAAQHGAENITLVVLDSHLDAVPSPLTSGAITYDMDTNPDSLYDPDDPFLKDRTDSYNASSFLHHLIKDGVVLAKNLFVVGISDYPPKRAFRIKDPRIKRFTRAYSGLRGQGARILTKKDLSAGTSKLAAVLRGINTPYVYISIDMDIGAMNACEGVRFRNWQGISEKQIYGLARVLADVLGGEVELVGMDVNEFNPRLADPLDRTYRIAANLIEMLCFGLEPSE